MRKRFISAVMAAVMLSLASVGTVSASAAETADSKADITEQVTASTHSSSSEESSKIEENSSDTDMADDAVPDFYNDPYYDTDGNATLIESEQIIYNTEEMQFIAVTTKDGHVFYVLINYTAENGQDNVYFLNKVDDYDLYALLYAGDTDKDGNAKYTPKEAAQAAEDANGRAKTDDSSDKADTPDESTSTDDYKTAVKKAPINMNSIYLVVGAAALIGVCAVGFILMKKKKDSGAKTPEFDPNEDYGSDNEDDLDLFDDSGENE